MTFHRHPQIKGLLLDRYRLAEERPGKQQFWVLAE